MAPRDIMCALFALCSYYFDYEHPPDSPFPCFLQPITGHPYALYAVECDEWETWIVCRCMLCGDEWQRRCSKDYGVARWTHRYALAHAHGAEPWAHCKLLPGAGLIGGRWR